MKRAFAIICTLMLSLGSISVLAQQSYPDEAFIYELDSVVTYTGNAPKITDFLVAFLNQDETSEVLGSLYNAWQHYLLGEPQEPCIQFMIDEKNGYLRYTYNSEWCSDYDDYDFNELFYYEMCYWNCSDGKHKIIADNIVSLTDGMYYSGQYSGTMFYIYDNATHKLYSADDELLGSSVQPIIDETDCETGEPMTKYDETIAVYHLPQQGKDITVDLYHGTKKKTGIRLVWDGMRFHRQDKNK